MNFKELCKKYAADINGEYQEYDDTQSVIIVPLSEGRFQTITGHITKNEEYSRDVVRLKTKVCELSDDIPFREILTESAGYPYAKFTVEDGFLKVEAIAFLSNLNEEVIKEMIMEIARHADDWELKITGKDIH
ncbi:MAG: hypothetical protein GDA51_00850 [Ekhidna sp.]|nr:hypothetical protein [Ekhidna sp.]MBC6410134.1 hypothetical protein [Ekhidna sp.]MBC6425030.1 hypothetical protein [Ekhidna sp.]